MKLKLLQLSTKLKLKLKLKFGKNKLKCVVNTHPNFFLLFYKSFLGFYNPIFLGSAEVQAPISGFFLLSV